MVRFPFTSTLAALMVPGLFPIRVSRPSDLRALLSTSSGRMIAYWIGSKDAEDRERLSKVSVVVAAPEDDEGHVVQSPERTYLHVYYPTEEASPLRVLLHADFAVKSDRTKVLPVDESPEGEFNNWMAVQLSKHVVDCVNRWYSNENPAATFRLLAPCSNRDTSSIAASLWELIKAHARTDLRVPDQHGNLSLTIANGASFIATSVRPDLARQVLAECDYGPRLVHPSLEEDKAVDNALRALDCKRLTDDDVFSAAARCSGDWIENKQLLWACVQWLAAWSAEQRKQDYEKDKKDKRLALLKSVPFLPADGAVHSIESLQGKIVTWRDQTLQQAIPEWLPLCLLDDWWRDRVAELSKDDVVRTLLADLGIQAPDDCVLLRAVGKSISAYWRTRQGDPTRFLSYLMTLSDSARDTTPQDVHKDLERCPVTVRCDGSMEVTVIEACKGYFGREWGEDLLAELFADVPDIAWVTRPEEDADRKKEFLRWLGVAEYPRLCARTDGESRHEEEKRVYQRLETTGYRVTSLKDVPPREVLDRTDPASLDARKSTLLLRLLARHWQHFKPHISSQVQYFYCRLHSMGVPASWWEELKASLVPPLKANSAPAAPLQKCWLPDHRTSKAIGELLPTIDLSAFEQDKDAVNRWLESHDVGVRTQLASLTPEEWKEILANRIPSLVSEQHANNDAQRKKLKRWYHACLDSLDDQPTNSSVAWVPLLCRRGVTWKYVDSSEPRWLADDNERAEALRDKIWQVIDLARDTCEKAKRYFGVRSLTELQEEPEYSESTGNCDPTLQTALDQAKPFVYAWRCCQSDRGRELRIPLKNLHVRVAEDLLARVKLDELDIERTVKKKFAVAGDSLLLSAAEPYRSFLAHALAEARTAKGRPKFVRTHYAMQ